MRSLFSWAGRHACLAIALCLRRSLTLCCLAQSSLFIIGIPLLWFSAPLSTFFWLVGSSIFLIGMYVSPASSAATPSAFRGRLLTLRRTVRHATLIEPGVESEYEGAEQV